MLQFLILALLSGIDAEERILIDYFLDHRTPSGMVLDGTHDRETVSVAATGFGMDCWAIAAHKGVLPREQAIQYIHLALDSTMAANRGNYGWLYHFTDDAGRPRFDGEVSSIDSALFYLGARQAALRIGDQPLLEKVNRLIDAVDLGWMLENGYDPNHKGKQFFSHGFYWRETGTFGDDGVPLRKPEFIHWDWKDYSEGVLLYRLFDLPYEPAGIVPTLPLFTYFYPLCFFNDSVLVQRLQDSVNYQIREYGIFGKTACMGPTGYGIMEQNIISPLAIWSCSKYIADAATTLEGLKVPKHAPWYQVDSGQVGTGILAIDAGSCLILLNRDLGMVSGSPANPDHSFTRITVTPESVATNTTPQRETAGNSE